MVQVTSKFSMVFPENTVRPSPTIPGTMLSMGIDSNGVEATVGPQQHSAKATPRATALNEGHKTLVTTKIFTSHQSMTCDVGALFNLSTEKCV